ncbi:MAG: 16S rRNA methyltransferase [Spirochaetaceae bacterium]|jgi:16S rRNA (cytosine1407-C5)-methyltransferase|nr:16S rRNA methyltransferase [Spirochaetaceae bacterium]
MARKIKTAAKARKVEHYANSRGLPAFEAYYTALYGERWPRLREALAENPRAEDFAQGLAKAYRLDRASVIAARCLRLPDAGFVLDACAAPGGKALALLSRMAQGVTLVANERSRERRRRLQAVLDEHLPAEKRGQVRVSGFDAASAGGRGSERGRFGAVLLDAPCSAERHLVRKPCLLERWNPAGPAFLAQRQWALLSAAYLLSMPGASLVYVTCAISPEENDRVSQRLLAKYPQGAALDRPDFQEGEETAFGRIILPDVSDRMGPLYIARFRLQPRAPLQGVD